MAFTLSNLLQNVYAELGQSETFLATGGTTGSIINTLDASMPNPHDDNYCIGGTAFVVRDAAGASAAPEGEYSPISAYLASTNTYTFTTITVAPASGDTIMVATSLIPLNELIAASNRALQSLGRIDLVDTSLTTSTSLTYTLPIALKYSPLLKVDYYVSDEWVNLPQDWYEIVPATAGSTATLKFRDELSSGYSMRLWYQGVHPTLSVYSSAISETIPERLIVTATEVEALKWLVSRGAGDTDFWKERFNWAKADLEEAHKLFKVNRMQRSPKYMTYTSNE